MTTPADLVREACDLLAVYIPILEAEIAEPTADGPAPSAHSRPADTPEPWNGPAARALMDAHEGVRRLEALIRHTKNGYPGLRRGGSDENTFRALNAIPKLAAGLTEDHEAAVARIISRWVNQARAIPAIDEAQQWRHIRTRPCPYCGCWFLKVLLDARGVSASHVECWTARCCDANGRRPAATITIDGLQWADGRTEAIPGLDDAA